MRNSLRRVVLGLSWVSVVLLLAACGEDDDTLTSLVITPNDPYLHSITLDPNARVAFKVIGTYASGLQQDLTATVVWSVEEPTLVSISNTPGSAGLAYGLTPGTTGIVALATRGDESLTTRTTLTVTDLDITALEIHAIHATMAPSYTVPSVPVGVTRDLVAIATFSDGTVKDLGSSAMWSSSDTNVLQVTPNLGRITGVAVGVANLTAALPDSAPAAQPLTTTTSVTVRAGPVDHTALTSACSTCHFKPTAHVATTDQCQLCHASAPLPFKPVARVDHTATDTSCGSTGCHQKGGNHPSTSKDCLACHILPNWSPTQFDNPATRATAHLAATPGRCVDCHALGASASSIVVPPASPQHIPTTASCDLCHTITGWTPTKAPVHSLLVIVDNCVQCHVNGINATAKSAVHPTTTSLCAACHVPGRALGDWRTLLKFPVDHTQTSDRCARCHDGVLATGMNSKPNHVVTTQSCAACHATSTWLTVH